MADRASRKWCQFCQCFHARPFPKVKDCRKAEPEYQRKFGMVPDMLDYN